MSGHSKWSTIKRQKAAEDAKRGRLFTKIGHEIVLAVREGGDDPEMNFRLRMALDRAKDANMPKDNIERAIKRGNGKLLDGGRLVEYIYEGYGPNGTAIMVEAMTDNKNRAVSEIRHVFSKYGGNLGSEGCVSWMFSHKGVIGIDAGDVDPDEIALTAIDAGAEDVEVEDDWVEIYARLDDFQSVQEQLEAAGYEIANSELSWIPQSYVSLPEKETMLNMKLVNALEDLIDVQKVFSNLDIEDDIIAKFEDEAA